MGKALKEIERDVRALLAWTFKETGVPAHQRQKVYRSPLVGTCAAHLLKHGAYVSDDVPVDFYRFELQDLGSRKVPFVLCVPAARDFVRAGGRPGQRGRCFVGCRFDQQKAKLEATLDAILTYYGYKLEFSDTGFKPGQIFDTVLAKLKSPDIDFAIFDNRATEKKPNVYIEVGAAYTMAKPHILLEYKKSVLPSDFGGFLTLKYSSYKELATRLSLLLPSFLDSCGIPARPRRRA